jgi:hypothetical protein
VLVGGAVDIAKHHVSNAEARLGLGAFGFILHRGFERRFCFRPFLQADLRHAHQVVGVARGRIEGKQFGEVLLGEHEVLRLERIEPGLS